MLAAKLGKQGREVQKRLQQQPYVQSSAFALPDSRDVHLLLSALTQNSTSIKPLQILSYVVNYFPKIRNEDNLKNLTVALLKNDAVFNGTLDSYTVIEALKSVFDSKIRVSEPFLPLTNFFHCIITAIYETPVDDWRKVLTVTGILLSRTELELHAIPETRLYFNKTYDSLATLNLELVNRTFSQPQTQSIGSLMVIAIGCSLPFWNESQRQKLPHKLLLDITLHTIFKQGLDADTDTLAKNFHTPILKHLNRLAFVIENSVTHVHFDELNHLLNVIMSYATTLYKRTTESPESWNVLKSILFAIVIMFQGVVTFSMQLYNGLKRKEYPLILDKVLLSLYHLNFILEKIGNAGFTAYNFVYITALDGVIQYGGGEQLGRTMIQGLTLSQNNLYQNSKVVFTLNFLEKLVPHSSEDYYHDSIGPLASKLLYSQNQSILESAHSVVLTSLSLPRNSVTAAAAAIPYLQILLSQYPSLISPAQLAIAVELIAQSVFAPAKAFYLNKDNSRELLHTLFLAALNSPELPVQKESYTIRSGIIISLIDVLVYVDPQSLEVWLDNVWELIQGAKNRELLEQRLWRLVSEGLDMHRANVAITWWYRRDVFESKL